MHRTTEFDIHRETGMMRNGYPEELIEEVRQKNDIVDVISRLYRSAEKGSNYVCCCPFHSEKTPSFAVSRSRQIYKCFGCGEGGNVVTFVMKYENCTFPGSVKDSGG